MTMQITSAQTSGTVTGSGVMALDRALGSLSFDFGKLPKSPFAGDLEMRFVGQVMYMKIPALEATGKSWFKIDFKELAKFSGFDLSQLTQLQSQNPASTLKYLEAVSGTVRKLGTDTVRGVKTTRYAATSDLEKAIASLPEGARAPREAQRHGGDLLAPGQRLDQR
jgi:hypothetical protein